MFIFARDLGHHDYDCSRHDGAVEEALVGALTV